MRSLARPLGPVVASLLLAALCLARPVAQTQQPSDDYATYMSAGAAALARQDYRGALGSFKAANALKNWYNAEALIGMSRAYLGLRDFKAAVDHSDLALMRTGDDKVLERQAHYQRGLALLAWGGLNDTGKLKDAEAEFRSVLAYAGGLPPLPAVAVDLGLTLLRLNRNADGLQVLEQFVADNPQAPEVSRARGLIENPASAREAETAPVAMTMLEGETLTLSELTGKVVLLDFWGTWCAPCRAATPDLVKFYKKMAGNPSFVMIGVAVNEKSEADWMSYVSQNKMTWHEFLDAKRQMALSFNVHEFPTYIVLGGNGAVRYRHAGWGKTAIGAIDNAVKAALAALTPKHELLSRPGAPGKSLRE